MTTKNIRRAVLCAFGAFAMLFAGATQAALQDRDLNGDTVVDAFYDTDLDITWLRNAFVSAGDWDQAADSVASFSFGGYSDWRLPTSDYCSDFNCTGSEMGHLWYVELGNIPGGPMTNTGDFQNLGSGYYWSGTELLPPMSAWAMYFHTGLGIQASFHKSNVAAAMAVRPGDVAAIPEPETLALMLAGLAGLALAQRRLGA